MAPKTDNASTFKIVAGLTALFLILAAGLLYLQGEETDTSSAELAALSQAIPAQAVSAVNGEDGAFDRLDSSVSKVASLRRAGAPGRSSDWQQLESQASAVLSRRAELEAVGTAASQMAGDAQAMLDGSNALLDISGSTAVIQEFQQRADRVRQAAGMLPRGGEGAAAAIADDIAFLGSVLNG